MKIQKTTSLIFVAFVFNCQTVLFAQTVEVPSRVFAKAPVKLAKVRLELIERVKGLKEPSFAVAVVQNGKVIWGETLGWADRDAGIASTPDTRYAVASVSKSITATGAHALISRGQIRLETRVSEFLGDSWAAYSDERQNTITVAQLLNHTSGIPHLWHYEYSDDAKSVVGTDSLIYSYAAIVEKPGLRFVYTNLGFGVLAKVIGKAGSDSFEAVIDKALFRRLKMDRTTTAGWLGDKGYARGYDDKGKPIPYSFRLAPDGGAGFFTTIKDLTNYTLFHLGAGGVLADLHPASASNALKKLHFEGRFTYERGWGIARLPMSNVLISDGQMLGGTAAIVLVPEKDVGVIVMCNKTGGPSDSTAVKILSALIPDFESQFGAAIGEIEKEIGSPGKMPESVFDGSIEIGDQSQKISLDMTDPRHPFLTLNETRYLLQKISWVRGEMLATAVGTISISAGKGRTHNLNFTIWPDGPGIGGFVQEEIADERPGSGLPHRLTLKRRD